MKRFSREIVLPPVIAVWQVVLYIVFAWVLRLIYRAKITNQENLKRINNGALIVANHQSKMDPFIILAHIPFFTYLNILPVRFPVLHLYMKKPVLGVFLKMWGSYDIGDSNREKMIGLYYTRELVQKKKTVMLFPEGKLVKDNHLDEFQKGLQFLAAECENVIFVRLRNFNKIKFSELLNFSSSMNISESFNFSNNDSDIDRLKTILQEM
jgi:1-acyl-sn-glycerol-3-phosphate acyltransferase